MLGLLAGPCRNDSFIQRGRGFPLCMAIVPLFDTGLEGFPVGIYYCTVSIYLSAYLVSLAPLSSLSG